MSKGKYGVKAAKAVAEHAAETAQELREQLSRERAEHAAEVTALKDQINRLSGQLTNKVKGLASDAVSQARREARDTVAAEREKAHQANLDAYRYLSTFTVDMSAEEHFSFLRLLGLEPGEVASDMADLPRAARRLTHSKFDRSVSRIVQRMDTGAPDSTDLRKR
jgi:hypothetical protein